MTIGEKIKSLRQKNDITQEKLAEYLHISYQAVSKWESNTSLPDISLVIPLANFFGVSTDELFGIADLQTTKETEFILKNVKELIRDLKLREALKLPRCNNDLSAQLSLS